MPKGQCHCGAVQYEMPTETSHTSLCHCSDCRRHSGAPLVAWALVSRDKLRISGETREYASSENGRRHFCPECGTSLFYTNEAIFPDKVDVQFSTLDDPNAFVPTTQIQTAERIHWMEQLNDIPEFERYPG
ncbi:MAG TPA: GFA family protein [Sphingomicrobium sp.]|nr:GFA family protein [Sphingomicrobium sp.]